MEKDIYIHKANIMKALSNPVRLRIIDLLSSGEKCVCEIFKELDLEQSHISKNLTVLKKAGIIKDRKNGLNVYYSLKIDCIKNFIDCVEHSLKN